MVKELKFRVRASSEKLKVGVKNAQVMYFCQETQVKISAT